MPGLLLPYRADYTGAVCNKEIFGFTMKGIKGYEEEKNAQKNYLSCHRYHIRPDYDLSAGMDMIMSSFKDTNTIFTTAGQLIPEEFTLDNYINGWNGFAGVGFEPFSKTPCLFR